MVAKRRNTDIEETRDWLLSLEEVLERRGSERVSELLRELTEYAEKNGVNVSAGLSTPYVNTIAADEQLEYPGDLELELKIQNLIRWNAMAMVVKANRVEKGIGGHIATYASASTLYEVAFNHFIRGKSKKHPAI